MEQRQRRVQSWVEKSLMRAGTHPHLEEEERSQTRAPSSIFYLGLVLGGGGRIVAGAGVETRICRRRWWKTEEDDRRITPFSSDYYFVECYLCAAHHDVAVSVHVREACMQANIICAAHHDSWCGRKCVVTQCARARACKPADHQTHIHMTKCTSSAETK